MFFCISVWCQEPQTSASHTLSLLLLFSRLPTWQAWNIPLTSLFAVCPHATAQDVIFSSFPGLCIHTSLTVNHEQSLSRLTVGMFFSCLHFQNLVEDIFVMIQERSLHLGDPDSFCFSGPESYFSKRNFVCLQLSATRAGK